MKFICKNWVGFGWILGVWVKLSYNLKWDADGSRPIVVLNPDLFEKPSMQNCRTPYFYFI